MPTQVIAYDIETAPIPFDQYESRQRRRLKKEYKYLAKRDRSKSVTNIAQRARSTHPFLGYICCIVIGMHVHGEAKTELIGVAKTTEQEKDLLRSFWSRMSNAPSDKVRFVTFNGKKFDAGFLKSRSMLNGLTVPRHDIIDDYPYSQDPHCDLANEWGRQNKWIALQDVSEYMGLSTSEDLIDGSSVHEARRRGDWQSIIDHCREDVRLTIEIHERIKDSIK